jgi:hypothetical protein
MFGGEIHTEGVRTDQNPVDIETGGNNRTAERSIEEERNTG